jgi:hypothetical protein
LQDHCGVGICVTTLLTKPATCWPDLSWCCCRAIQPRGRSLVYSPCVLKILPVLELAWRLRQSQLGHTTYKTEQHMLLCASGYTYTEHTGVCFGRKGIYFALNGAFQHWRLATSHPAVASLCSCCPVLLFCCVTSGCMQHTGQVRRQFSGPLGTDSQRLKCLTASVLEEKHGSTAQGDMKSSHHTS